MIVFQADIAMCIVNMACTLGKMITSPKIIKLQLANINQLLYITSVV